MFADLFERRRERKALEKWAQSEIGQILAQHTAEYLKYPRIADMSEDGKKNIVNGFYQDVFALSHAANPFLAMREKLASYVVGFAELAVLCLTEEEKKEQWYAECPYISGQLHLRIDQAAHHVNELKEILWKHPDITKVELVSYCNTRCVVLLYYLNGMNYVRREFNDIDEQKDWLRPFMRSMLIWEEDLIREKIGQPRLLTDFLDNIKHSTFMNIVVNGHKNPYFEWEKSWEKNGPPAF
jgi:hypothetical protein